MLGLKPGGEAKVPRRADNQIKEWLESWAWGGSPAVDVVNKAHALVLDNGGSKGLDERVVKLSKTIQTLEMQSEWLRASCP